MRLKDSYLIDSPEATGRVRLVGEVTLDEAPDAPEQLYVDVPAAYADGLSTTGDPWLVLLTIIAAHLGEPLRLDKPVERALYAQAHDLVQLFYGWGWTPQRAIPIEADVYDLPPQAAPAPRVALFFTGGVDSFFSLLSDNAEVYPERRTHVTDLFHLWGMDIRLHQAERYATITNGQRRVAETLGKTLVDVKTNARGLLERVAWEKSHGTLLGFVGKALEGAWGEVRVASDADYHILRPWGTHPHIVESWSTRQQRWLVDGAGFRRIDKIAYIAAFPVAQQSVRVCGQNDRTDNCSLCGKCVRTMVQLDAVGALEKFTAFDKTHYERSLRTVPEKHFKARYLPEIREVAARNERADLLQKLDRLEQRWQAPTRRARLERFLAEWVLPARLAHSLGDALDWGYTRIVKRGKQRADAP